MPTPRSPRSFFLPTRPLPKARAHSNQRPNNRPYTLNSLFFNLRPPANPFLSTACPLPFSVFPQLTDSKPLPHSLKNMGGIPLPSHFGTHLRRESRSSAQKRRPSTNVPTNSPSSSHTRTEFRKEQSSPSHRDRSTTPPPRSSTFKSSPSTQI